MSKNEAMEPIHHMCLHDYRLISKNLGVLRVPGGWIYYTEQTLSDGSTRALSNFVPMNNEFETLF